MQVGISQPVGGRWFRDAGGMPPSHLSRSSKPLSRRYLSFADREEIALLRAQGLGVREVARRLGRAASTISRGSCPLPWCSSDMVVVLSGNAGR
jgi:hypothetical protein